MKKIFALVLTLVIMLCFAGCGEQELYDEANALLEAENYEEALAKFQELGDYEDSAAKCEEAEKNIENKKLYDEAVNLVNSGEYGEAFNLFNQIKDYKDVNTYLDRFTTIEITPENWQTYFELKTAPVFSTNSNGELNNIFENTWLVIKDEYAEKLNITDDLNVEFDFSYEAIETIYNVDNEKFTYEVQKTTYDVGDYPVKIQYNNNTFFPNGETQIINAIAADFEKYSNILCTTIIKYYEESGKWVGLDMENPELLKVKGCITIFE